jgi:hypothetical protein
MLTLVPSRAFLRIRATGRLTAADYRSFEPGFAAELKRGNPMSADKCQHCGASFKTDYEIT